MSFTDTLKKSLGFEETEDNKDKPKNEFSLFLDDIRDALKPKGNPNNNQQYRQEPQKQYGQTPRPTPTPSPKPKARPTPVYDEYEVIIPD